MIFIQFYSLGIEYKFKKITVSDGLSTRWVKCFLRDNDGFLWIGTADGLNKYDGVSIKTYKFSIEETTTINHNYINTIFEDSKNIIWIGTQRGVNLYIKEKDCFLRINKISDYISCFYELKNGIILVGGSYGLYFLNPQNFSIVNKIELLGTEKFAQSENEFLWIGTRIGMYKMDLKTYNIEKFSSLGNVSIRSLLVDDLRRLWIGTDNDGVFVLEKNSLSGTYKIMNFKNNPKINKSLSEGTIYALEKDKNGNIWIGIENGGINIISSSESTKEFPEIEKIYHDPLDQYSLIDNSIHALYYDIQDIMWIGTYGGGISYVHELFQRFKHVRSNSNKPNSMINNYINVIYDEENYTYIGTESGLSVFDKSKKIFQNYVYEKNNPFSISSNSVWTILRDSRGNLWIGTWKGGLNLFEEKTKKFIKFFPSIENKYFTNSCITKIYESSDGLLWIATLGGGLYEYDYKSGNFKLYKRKLDGSGISCNWIYDIIEDINGNLWIASTEAVDVFYRKENKFKKYVNTNDPGSISYSGAISLFKDSKGNIWIGTSNGLNAYNYEDDKFKVYTTKDGLPNNNIKAIIEDDSQNIWISTGKGISKFVKGVYKPEKPEFINYDVNDGLQENEFNPRCVFKNKEGYIFFGGSNGYNIFYPDSLKEYRFVPRIALTYITISSKNYKNNNEANEIKLNLFGLNEIKIKRKYSIIKIEFASLDLISPKKNQYAYYLKGFEKSWKYVGNQNFATYTNLNPGKYTFKVKASNCDGVWNNSAKTLKVIILPAWYETFWAKLLYLSILVFIIYIFLRLRYKLWIEHQEKIKIEELGNLKFQFFTNISHEIRTPLTLIIAPLKELIEKGEFSDKLHYVYRNALRLKTLVDQIMDFSKLENQMMKIQLTKKEVGTFILNILNNFIDFAVSKNIELTYKSTFSRFVGKIDEDKIEKIITNVVINALKFTPKNGRIEIFTEYNNEKKSLIIEIADTGKGIAPDEMKYIFERFFTSMNVALTRPGTGIGLNLTHKLVELMKGEITVESKIGKGTKFRIVLPVECIEMRIGEVKKHLTKEKKTLKNNNIKEKNKNHEYSVLIIDDDEEMCSYLEEVLSEHFKVYTENNAMDAYNKLQDLMPNIILLDIMMPDFNGLEFCHKIKNDIRYCHIPIIVLTARFNSQDQIKSYEEGADDYIIKPFEEDVLIARINNLLRRKENIRKELIGMDLILNKNINISSLDVEFMEKVMKIIQENYTDTNFNINHIIEKLGISRSVFYKKIKTLSNQPIHEIIMDYRLKKAKELLLTTNMNITEISSSCGFEDAAYFSKVFKKKYGISPKEFKNNHN